ncbi:hypothetical protein GDO78_009049 [Eleutherodactylus coqui]|nr:hypothetical protein GDO78_009049 [Eleutherodactylus coqui]
MGRGSPCATTPPWSCKVTFWTLAVSLLLLSVMTTTGSPTPVTEVQPNTQKESDSFGAADPKSKDFFMEEKVEQSIKSPAVPMYENTTTRGHRDDGLPDNVLFRAKRSHPGKKNNMGKRERAKNGECRLHSVTVHPQDLGLGYESDEKITINYCMGTCKKSSNYDLALSTLLKNKHIAHSSQRRISSQPCCRPTRYGPVAFLNKTHHWQTIENSTALDCSCGG